MNCFDICTCVHTVRHCSSGFCPSSPLLLVSFSFSIIPLLLISSVFVSNQNSPSSWLVTRRCSANIWLAQGIVPSETHSEYCAFNLFQMSQLGSVLLQLCNAFLHLHLLCSTMILRTLRRFATQSFAIPNVEPSLCCCILPGWPGIHSAC